METEKLNLSQKILRELERDAWQTNAKLGKKFKVSEGTVRQRIEKLKKAGVIKRFTVELSTRAGFSALVLIATLPRVQTEKVVKRFLEIAGVKKVFETAGETDIVVEVSTDSAESFNGIIEKIRAIDGVETTKSLTVLKIS